MAWALREPAYVRWALSPLGHREPRKWTLQHYMGSQHSQAARPQTLKCLLPFWLTSASPKICTYKAHSFPFAQLSHNNWGWTQGKTSGKDYPQLQAQVWMLPQRPSQQRGTHLLWVLRLWWFTLCVNLARLGDPVVWSNKSKLYITYQQTSQHPLCLSWLLTLTHPFSQHFLKTVGVIVIIFGNKMLKTSQP